MHVMVVVNIRMLSQLHDELFAVVRTRYHLIHTTDHMKLIGVSL